MSYERSLFFIGIWVALLSFLGFPIQLRKILFIITGILIALIAYLMYKKSLVHKRPEQKTITSDTTPTSII